MRRAALAIVSTVAALVLLLSFKTHSVSSSRPAAIGAGTTGTSGSDDAGDSGTPSMPTTPSASSSSAGPARSGSSSAAAKTYTGASTDTQWGPVQVQITVRNGKITKVSVVDYPHGNPRDDEINSYALPQLVQETLSAQSAKIDTVSGATVTSGGYLGSLQSAIDKAGL
jgi:uncharacterized protein with FMN-binding domain